MQDQSMKSLLLRIASLEPSSTIHCPFLSSLLNKCLLRVFKFPTHPPYDSMIKRAVKELNEKSGSTEEDISKFIRREYDNDLPFDHAFILHSRLKKFCMSGELLCTENGKYVFVDCESEVEEEEDDDEEDEEEEDTNNVNYFHTIIK
ncbi:putative winged helix-turn-helix DNA-binding domain-containing protein [Medicago truncatula]|nr:putative winged helix-turn-helix DNA-binding domain-containing protein [Medicago truncatula]